MGKEERERFMDGDFVGCALDAAGYDVVSAFWKVLLECGEVRKGRFKFQAVGVIIQRYKLQELGNV
jgi:hypothetical protein